MGKYKKAVKAEVAAAKEEVDNNLDVDMETLAKSQSTRKEIRKEARNRRKNKSEVLRTGPIKKTIPADAKGLLSMVQTPQGKDVVKNRFDYTKMPDGSSITRKCSYNSKRK